MLLPLVHTPDIVAIVSVTLMSVCFATGKHFAVQLRHVRSHWRRRTVGMCCLRYIIYILLFKLNTTVRNLFYKERTNHLCDISRQRNK